MSKDVKIGWICWGLCLVISAALAVFLAVPRNACFWVAVLGTVMCLILTGIGLRGCSSASGKAGGFMGLPVERIVAGVLFLQLVIGFVLMALSNVCPWLVAALVECVLLTVDAAALTSHTEEDTKDQQDGEQK